MKIRIVDAFTARPFAGNPAGVVLLGTDGFPDDDRMQQLAAEVNLSETAFAHPLPPGEQADWALRWFTPVTEVDMCGHATLATAHVLLSTGTATGGIRFATRSGVLRSAPADDGTITLDFPTAPLTAVEAPTALAEALGAPVLSAYDTGRQVGDLLVELPDEKTVRALSPDLAAIGRLPHRGLIVTAGAGSAEDGAGRGPADGYDFVSRFFGPAVGISEDPVTGSAHTALAPFWSARLGRHQLTGLQVSARTGLVRTTLHGDRTLLTGHAVTVIEGELLAALA
ncbi:PhzF family phenazine biosynthesis protein [Streptantibioticus ferralitis]|uniref:PhzF family phenazine biosynthesis protein n=1 Tax=Streptantibioticus ferralitis TaxID=236510 RepID=A0ABT5Z957_9ACTN|nr:PhzF family phenazine biosynthesis protein [Streptantibioticus ferralitis]MDF2260177.1 PhzF family phenazine biosynthesis protein [Streptantibioticus ferralitis]